VLTATQALSIATLNPVPPWKVSVLRSWYAAKPFSLRAAIATVESRKVYACLQVRDPAILRDLKANVANPALMQKVWNDARPSPETLSALSSLVNIVYVSRDHRTVIISGTMGSWAKIPTGKVPSLRGA
jgi:hypothetical protein